MRLRTTLAAVLVVAVALLLTAALLVLAVRASLRDVAETTAEQRATELAAQVDAQGSPLPAPEDHDTEDGPDEPDEPDEPEDIVWQVAGADGRPVSSSSSLTGRLPREDGVVDLPGGEHAYVVASEDAGGYVVTAAVSLEAMDEATAALVAPLALGIPLLLVVVGTTTWLVVGRALRPVERIRTEVEGIRGSSLERRVPVPPGRDEIGRLARTMNLMLGRLQDARDQQQQFVSDASHELRSPVASLRQAAEVAQAHPAALPEGELAATVLEESLRMQVLVDQLLVLARAGEGARRMPRIDVDLDDLVLVQVRRVGRQGPTVDTRDVGPGRVRGDALALDQVVRNLLDNAVRHATRSVVVRLVQRAEAVVLTVEDDGPGIPEAEREHVFERFRRLDEARARDAGGSGLGLAIVREVVAAHGGSVVLDSSPLGGARFVVRLPA